jgi:cyclophilin family peptidyl-prolyl cis-trans isomerase
MVDLQNVGVFGRMASVAVLVFGLIWVGCGSTPEPESAPETAPAAESAPPPAAAAPDEPKSQPEIAEAVAPEPPPAKAAPKAEPEPPPAPQKPRVVMSTSKGDMVIELEPEAAPETVKNFLGYVEEGFYEGTIFHRVIPGFMIQGGGHTPDLAKKDTKDPIRNEATNGLKNLRGTISMARTANPHSATSQFFINHADNAMLDNSPQNGWGYAVFGKVVEGMDVLDAIAATPTGNSGGMGDVPRETILIKSVKRGS